MVGLLKKFHFIYPSVNFRIIVPFLSITIVVSGIGVYIVTRLVSGSIQERLNNQLLDSATSANSAIIEIERQQLRNLRVLVFTEGVTQAVQEENISDLDNLLRPVITNAAIEDVIVFDQQGHIIYEVLLLNQQELTYITPSPRSLQEFSSVERILQGETDPLGDKFVERHAIDDREYFYFAAPLLTTDNSIIGGILTGISANRLTQLISEQSVSRITLYTEEGQLISTTFRQAPQENLTLSELQIQELTTALQSENTPIKAQVIDDQSYQTLYSYLVIREENIGILATSLPNSFIAERVSTSRNLFVLLFLALFSAISILGIVVSRSIVLPVRHLVAISRDIRGGDWTKRVDLKTPDELGELSQSFDAMTEKLVQQNTAIRQLYEDQLEKTAQRDAILTGISDAVITISANGQTLLQNEAASLLIETIHLTEYYAEFLELYQHPEQVSLLPRVVIWGEKYYSVLSTTIAPTSDQPGGFVLLFRDISEILSAERMKDQIILQLSHELKTPLTASRGYVDLVRVLQKNILDEKSLSHLHKAVDHMEILEYLVNQVVLVSLIDSQGEFLDLTEIDLISVLHNSIEAHESLIAQKSLQAEFEAEQEQLVFWGDPDRLQQAFEKIIHNACIYNRDEGLVRITVRCSPEIVMVYINDTGVGIDKDEREKIFERMYRGKAAEADSVDSRGLGLGLFIAKEIIDRHQGRVYVSDSNIWGSEVIVELPFLKENPNRATAP